MKVYRGFDKQYGPILYDNWIYVTLNPQMAKWYATRNGEIEDGAIIEYDLDNNIKILDVEEAQELVIKEYDIEVSEDTLLYYCEEIYNVCSKYADGIKFLDIYSGVENEWIYIIFDAKFLHNPRELSTEEFDNVQLRESIIDAKSVGDDLMNIILKNPTRKELTENNMDYSRGALGKNGNFYFISLSELAHIDMFDTLEQLKINEEPYLTFKYDNKSNTFYFYIPDYNEENLNNCIKELKKSPYIINFNGYTCDIVDDTDFDPKLYESVNNNNFITLYRGFDTRYGNFGSPNSFIWATDDIDIAKMYVDKNETSALLQFQIDSNKLEIIFSLNDDWYDFCNEYGIEEDGIDFDEECAQWCRSKGYNCFIHGSDEEYWIILDTNLIMNPTIIK